MNWYNFNKLKLFGLPRAYFKFNIFDPVKVKYLQSKKHGTFITSSKFRNREINNLLSTYRQMKIYEKHFNPLGFKQKQTETFPKQAEKEELVDFKFILLRSNKTYKSNQLKFIVDMNMDKLQIKQVLEKLYGIKVLKVTTAIQPGVVKRESINEKGKRGNRLKIFRIPERKVAVITTNKEVPSHFRELDRREKSDEEKSTRKSFLRYRDLPESISKVEGLSIIPKEKRRIFELIRRDK